MAPFKYRGGERKVEDVVRKSKQSGGSYDSYLLGDVSFMKIKEGDQQIRILPRNGIDDWEIQIQLHRNVGPDNGTYLCLKMKDEECPICEARRLATDDAEKKALSPQWRALAWAIDRGNEKAGPQIMSLPITLFREINSKSIARKSGNLIHIDDPEEGFDIFFNREGTDIKTKYTGVEVDPDGSSPIHSDQKKQERWLDLVTEYPLSEILVYYDADHIEKVLYGKKERRRKVDEEETTEEETPRRRRAAAEPEDDPAPRRRRAAAEEEPEAEEPAPRRRRAEPEEEPADEPAPRRRRAAVEDSGDPTDAEADEPAPRRRRPAAEEEPESEEPAPRRRAAKEPEEDEPAPRRRAAKEPEEDEPAPRRRAAAKEPEEDADSPSSQARGKMERLRSRARE